MYCTTVWPGARSRSGVRQFSGLLVFFLMGSGWGCRSACRSAGGDVSCTEYRSFHPIRTCWPLAVVVESLIFLEYDHDWNYDWPFKPGNIYCGIYSLKGRQYNAKSCKYLIFSNFLYKNRDYPKTSALLRRKGKDQRYKNSYLNW
jgi:hypothetical protein